ncbi:MAG: serine/threonine-protein kinase, partial [Acidobacteriota bacterium]
MPLSPGTRLGRYEVVRLLGAGGMGEVYLAKDERLQREVALKVLPTGTLADEVARKRFRNEALALSKLSHPNIAMVHDFDTHGGADFLVMECVPGQTLAQKLAGGALTEKEVSRLGAQIASALEEAHERGVVHRD